jgi:predicted HicB family RNase H-like nuclease
MAFSRRWKPQERLSSSQGESRLASKRTKKRSPFQRPSLLEKGFRKNHCKYNRQTPERNTTMPERKLSQAKIDANNRYNAKAYDRINIAIPKGMKERIKAAADSQGVSVNAFMGQLISEKLEQLGQ